MPEKRNLELLTDHEILERIKINPDALGIVYKKCKKNTIFFLRKITNGSLKDYELEDVFHDGVLILYEKIISENFILTCALQTYLNAVCRYQLLNKLNASKLNADLEDYKFDNLEDMQNLPTITEGLAPIEDENETQFEALEKALITIKEAGGKCYELLTLFWYHKKSINQLTEQFGYTNDVNTRNQKSKCQERLRVLSFQNMHKSKK